MDIISTPTQVPASTVPAEGLSLAKQDAGSYGQTRMPLPTSPVSSLLKAATSLCRSVTQLFVDLTLQTAGPDSVNVTPSVIEPALSRPHTTKDRARLCVKVIPSVIEPGLSRPCTTKHRARLYVNVTPTVIEPGLSRPYTTKHRARLYVNVIPSVIVSLD